jgi:hypothetical protein
MQVIENCAAKRQVPARAARQTMPLYGTNGPAGSSGLASTAYRRYVVYQRKNGRKGRFFSNIGKTIRFPCPHDGLRL